MSGLRERISKLQEEERRYKEDVSYEVYRRGGNVDRIDDNRVESNFHNNSSVERCAEIEVRKQKRNEVF